ncbi:hypothetical protein ACFL12_04035 [Pseudomonadota bacterium]
MTRNIVAVNPGLGVVVVEETRETCTTLHTMGRLSADIGDKLAADWDTPGGIVVHNVTRGTEFRATVDSTGVPRSEAIGSMTII